MKPFEESMRYEYDLTPESVVWDCGGFKGDFADGIFQRYKCFITIFEPVFPTRIKERFNSNPKIIVKDFGIGGKNDVVAMVIKGDMTGVYAESENGISPAKVVSISDASKGRTIDLLKLNIEGMEFETLETVLRDNIASRFKNIQVQFHQVVPNFEERYQAIREGLLKTHALTFDYPWVWENYRLK